MKDWLTRKLTGRSQQELFWKWFEKNQNEYLALDHHSPEKLAAPFDRLSRELSKIDKDLRFEFGPEKDGRKEFFLSAGGICAVIPAVEALMDCAPDLPRWKIFKFKQQKVVEGVVLKLHGKELDVDTLRFHVEADNRRVAVTVYFPDFVEEEMNIWGEIGFLVLDAALGEYAVMTCMGAINFKNMNEAPADGVVPARLLSDTFANCVEQVRAAGSKGIGQPDLERLGKSCSDWWNQIESEDLVGQELESEFSYYTADSGVRDQLMRDISTKLGIEASFSEDYSALGKGFAVYGSVPRSFESRESLEVLSNSFMSISRDNKVLFDGFSIRQRAGMAAGNVQMVVMMGQQLIAMEQYGPAMRMFQQGLRESPGNPELLGLLGYVQAKAGAREDAQTTLIELRTQLSDATQFPATRWNAACALSIIGNVEEALVFLREAVSINPQLIDMARTDDDLVAVRSHPEFQSMVAN